VFYQLSKDAKYFHETLFNGVFAKVLVHDGLSRSKTIIYGLAVICNSFFPLKKIVLELVIERPILTGN